MKIVLRLAILFAALLLIANMALAKVCDEEICYNVTENDEYGFTNNDFWRVCLNNNGTGELCSLSAEDCYALYLFGGGSGWFNTSGAPGLINGNPTWTTWILHGTSESAFLQPIGGGTSKGDMITAEGVHDGTRYTALGIKVPCVINQLTDTIN